MRTTRRRSGSWCGARSLGADNARRSGAFGGRREDDRFVTGKGRYTGEWSLPGELYAVFRRSEVAAARIRRVDIEEARRQPGVRAVLLGGDFPEGFGTLIPAIDYPGRGGSRRRDPYECAAPRRSARRRSAPD